MISKLLRKGANILDKRKEQDKLGLWQERLSRNKALAPTVLYDQREALYAGTKEIDSVSDKPAQKASYVRNIVAELVEAQVDSNIPQPKVTARHKRHEPLANLIENMLRNELDRLPFETLNDEQERTTPIQGGSLFLCEWDSRRSTHQTVGELAISLLHPKQVIPQAGVTEIREMDYIILQVAQTKEAIKRRYGVDVTDESESAPDTRGAGMDPARDMVTQNIAYYRNKQGGIGRFSWVNDVVLEDYADYQARRLHRCKKCGENGDGNQCVYCGSRSFEEVTEEYETLAEDAERSDGTVIPMDSGEVDEYGFPVPTRIPRYKPDAFPLVLRRNVSVFGQFLGDSDVDKIRDMQNEIKKLDTKIDEKLTKGGSYVTLPKGVYVRKDDTELKVLELENPAQKAMVDVLNIQPDVGNDMGRVENAYQSARQIIGITDSFQGRRDTTATSGKAKEFAAAQSAGRLESKRVMKNAAYAQLFELMFKFMLAYADEPRPVTSKDSQGNVEYGVFNRYDFLEQDDAGQWYWVDDFLFSCDTSAPLANNREAMWQETRMNFRQGAFGDPASIDTLILFWTKMELLHYPGAGDTKTYLQNQKEAQQHGMPEMPGAGPDQQGLYQGGGGQLPGYPNAGLYGAGNNLHEPTMP